MRLRGILNRPATAPGRIARAFRGPAGLHTAWRILLFLVLFALQLAAIITVLNFALKHLWPDMPHPARITPLLTAITELALLTPILGATAIMARLEDRPFTAYGLGGPRKVPQLAAGFAAGLALLTLLIALLAATGYGVFSASPLAAIQKLRYGAEWLIVCLLIGLTEELTFRGYLLQAMARRHFLPAALITSVMFGAAHGHNPGETFIGLVDAGAAGLLLCVGIYFTKSLYWSIGLHAAWDFSENYLFGTSDSGSECYGTLINFAPHGNIWLSGGATGPEGSVFAVALIALATAAAYAAFSAQRKMAGDRLPA
jgi:membrane protease YdiL (CAAX protease family)